MRVPFQRPAIDEDEITAVADCLRSGWLTTGPEVQAFERELAAFLGARHAVAVSSGSAALELSMHALGLGPGDEVVTSPYSFIATFQAIRAVGATPVFADVEPTTGNLDVAAAARAIGPRTRAILPVHIAGHPCDLAGLETLCRQHDLLLIEDAAHALGASFGERAIGAIGDATCFSFYATKNLTTGEGGMITCADAEFAARLERLRLHGIGRDAWHRGLVGERRWEYDVVERGYKCNLSDLAAALGRAQLEKLPARQQRRAQIAAAYDAGLADLNCLELPPRSTSGRHAWHLYMVRLAESVDRDRFLIELAKRGVEGSVHFRPLFHMSSLRGSYGLERAAFPRADALARRVASIPLYPGLHDDEVAYVADSIRAVGEELVK